jgi:hypothetical protein
LNVSNQTTLFRGELELGKWPVQAPESVHRLDIEVLTYKVLRIRIGKVPLAGSVGQNRQAQAQARTGTGTPQPATATDES